MLKHEISEIEKMFKLANSHIQTIKSLCLASCL